uniref:Uncharacterized protein n=1 Tax=Triticum urartu TaxID=4572 RepID=A0A8R7TG23_TRIUA
MYSSLPCNSIGWTRAYPTVMTEKFSSEQSGICSIYIRGNTTATIFRARPQRYVDEFCTGTCPYHRVFTFIIHSNRKHIALARIATLHKILKLERNRSDAHNTAMQHIKSSINTLWSFFRSSECQYSGEECTLVGFDIFFRIIFGHARP